MNYVKERKRIADIRLKAEQAALMRHPSTHSLILITHMCILYSSLLRGCVYTVNVSRIIVFVCDCVWHPCLFSLQIHLHVTFSFFSVYLFIFKVPPTLFWSFFPQSSLPLALSHLNKHMRPSIHPPTAAVGTGESPTSSAVWHGTMQRNTKIVAALLPNGVAMATKGARPCNVVQTRYSFLNLYKHAGCVKRGCLITIYTECTLINVQRLLWWKEVVLINN